MILFIPYTIYIYYRQFIYTIGKCIEISQEDERRLAEKHRIEIENDRGGNFTDAKKEMNDIIKSELDEVHSCLRSCNSDLNNIGICICICI